MYSDLYQRKYKYEKLIRNLNDVYIKLEEYYSNLFLYRKKIISCLNVDGQYYKSDIIESKIDDIKEILDMLKKYIIPQTENKYSEILYEISKL